MLRNLGPAFPSASERKNWAVIAAVESACPDWEQAEEAEITRPEYERLLEAWSAFKGPVKNPDHFIVCVKLDDYTEERPLYAVAEYQKPDVKVYVDHEDDIDPDLCRIVKFAGKRQRPERVGPNEKCPCGSGRKYKKCCEFRG